MDLVDIKEESNQEYIDIRKGLKKAIKESDIIIY